MSTIVKALKGSVNVETNIDYNFTYPTPQMSEAVITLVLQIHNQHHSY